MDYIQIGKIINTHGIKGEVKVQPLTDDITRFDCLKTVYLGNDKLKVKVEGIKYHKNMVILKFERFNNINEVLSYKEDFIYIDEKEKIDLPDNHFFIFDIIGCLVFNTEGEKIGIITQVLQSVSNDIYIVKDDEKNKEYMIPAVKEFFININIDKKEIVIDPIEGMIE